ncbi:UNVERIFIED_CONTAM: hypothetical protein FKN15_025387 [Acipenser sinensis]
MHLQPGQSFPPAPLTASTSRQATPVSPHQQDLAARRSKRHHLQLPPSRLFYKDWPLARLLKALFDSGIRIPPSADREALFLLYCSSTAAQPVFPPLKRRRVATGGRQSSFAPSSPELLPAQPSTSTGVRSSSLVQRTSPSSRSTASGSPASDLPPATTAVAQHPTGPSRQSSCPTAPRSTPQPPAAATATGFQSLHQGIFQEIKEFMQPFDDYISAINSRLDIIEVHSSTPLPPAADPDPAPVFSLASASVSGPHPAPATRCHTISPALRRQIIEGKDVNLISILIPTAELTDHRVVHCGDVSVTLKSSDPRLLKNLTLGEFVLAFSIFRDVLCTAYPHRREELDLYLAYVVELSVRYGSTMFFEYHESFSAAVLATDNIIVNWATPDNYLFNQVFGGLRGNACGVCASTGHSTHLCPKTASASSSHITQPPQTPPYFRHLVGPMVLSLESGMSRAFNANGPNTFISASIFLLV